MTSQRTLAYSKKGRREEVTVVGHVPRNDGLKGKAFGKLLEKVPGKPDSDHEYLIKRASRHASLRERRIETTPVLHVVAVDGIIIEIEVMLYDCKERLRAIGKWEPEKGASFTRVD